MSSFWPNIYFQDSRQNSPFKISRRRPKIAFTLGITHRERWEASGFRGEWDIECWRFSSNPLMFVFLFYSILYVFIFSYFNCILYSNLIFSFIFSWKKSDLKLLRLLNTLRYRSSLTDSTPVFPGDLTITLYRYVIPLSLFSICVF